MSRIFPVVVRRTTVVGGGGEVSNGFNDTVQVDVQLTTAETLTVTDDYLVGVLAGFDETLPAQTDVLTAQVDVAAAETLAAPSDAYTVDITAAYAETLAAQTDALTGDVQGSLDDTLPAQTDAQTVAVGVALADTVPAATDRSGESVVVGATTVTQTTGTGWTTPANAQGLPNGTLATITRAAGVQTGTATGTLTGTYASLGAPDPASQVGTVTLTFTYSATIGTLASGSLQFSYSLNNGGAFTNAGAAITATTALTTLTATVTLPVAQLNQLQFRAVASVTNSATGAATFNLDAVTATFDLTA